MRQIQAGNLLTTGLISSTGNINAANIAAGNITSAIISATGNITGPNIVATILSVSTLMSVSGNIQGGNFLTDGLISTTGNITSSYFLGNGRSLTGVQLTSIATGTSQVNIPVASSNANITIGATSNVAVFATTGAYITGLVSATSNVVSNNVVATTIVNAASHTGGLVSVTGNVTGSNLTIIGISNLNSNANVKITGGSTGQLLSTDGAGNLTWISSGNIAPTSGTWTPTLVPETGSYTLTINNTYFQKIGGVAFCTFDITIASVSTPNGNVIMGNLPFTSASTAATTGSLAVSFFTGMNSPTNVVSGTVPGSATTITMFWQGSSDTKMDPLTHNRLKATTRFVGSVYYATV